MIGRGRAALVALGALLALGCRCSDGAEPGAEAARPPEPRPAPAAAAPEKQELLARLGSCDVIHRGLLFDLGTPGVNARRGFSFGPFTDSVPIDRDGATFERVLANKLSFDFWLDERIERPMVSLRVSGGSARLVHVSIDDIALGAMRLPKEDIRILATPGAGLPLEPGRHRLHLRFRGIPRDDKSPVAELDWLRIGEREPEPTSYAAPTQEDIVADVVLDRVPKKSLVLRAPSSVRCWLRPSEASRLEVSIGQWGGGRGVAEIRALRDGQPPVVLQTRKVSGGESAAWTPVTLDLGAYGPGIQGLEFSAIDSTHGGRLAFGDPVLVRRDATALAAPRARVVVLVVLSSVDRRKLPPWGPTGKLTTLADLARSGIVFSRHRAPTSVASASLATLLTGLPPRAHGLEDVQHLLAPELRTVGEIVKEANGRTALFTGVPTSFRPFGFDQGWDVYDAISPVKDLPATEPMARAERWLDRELDGRPTPILVVIHARGAHPPWDVSREEALQLRPPEYSGTLDPRRGGILIGSLRARRQRAQRRLLDDDWVRLNALAEAVLAKQDAALGRIVALLRGRGVWDQTLFAVTSDVGPGAPPELPFDPQGPLTEDRLLLPFVMKLPGNALAGREVQVATGPEDWTVTTLNALGLAVPPRLSGLDLYARARGREPLVARAEVASLPGSYASRLGSRLLHGDIGAVPKLCALDVDPACATDIFANEPIAARALWYATFESEVGARQLAPPEAERLPVDLDEETAAALVVWGDRQ
ncbi:MAG TPA: sulfatase-like hydrolase/transferase [Polyangiaceae bacterium]|nr:sulfatase-like hydrolase/transferase [Polyangiaceae bacterium]